MNKPILGISMGDPFGNGPEITVKALADKTIYDRCRPLVIGDVSSMEYAAKVAKTVSGIDMKIRSVKNDKHLKSLACSNGEIDVTTVILCKFHRLDILCITACNPDCTDWDFGCSTTRTGSACCSNCEVNTKSFYSSLHHCLCHFLTYRSLLFKELMVNAKQVFFHLVGVRDYATLKICRGTRNGNYSLGYTTSRAALC